MDEEQVTYFGQTDSRGKKVPFGIKRKDRSRHTYVIGKTGMGKSTLLENMAIQDIQRGEGLAFIDPHGKTADLLLEYVPESRIKDVLYFAPFDMEYPISFNVMENVGADRRHLVANGLMSTFEKIWVDAWSARMAYILNNTILALLEYPDATLLGINRMLADKDFRKKVVDCVTDPGVKSFWVDEFAKYSERYAQEATPAIQNKVGQFTSNPLIRNIIGQPHSTFDIRKIMDEKKILIINLSKGRVGEGNANLLGSMLITKIYLAAMSRADMPDSEVRKLPNFYLYVDEFQSFANKSFADILSEARKYKLNLTIAHQYIEQMEEEVRAAVFGNVGTMVTFRVGAFDAEVLEKEFAPQFTAVDLVNLGIFQIYLKLMINGVSSQPFSATTLPPILKPEKTFVPDVIKSSRDQFAQPRAKVESDIRDWHQPIVKAPEPKAAAARTDARTSAPSSQVQNQSRPQTQAQQPQKTTQPVASSAPKPISTPPVAPTPTPTPTPTPVAVAAVPATSASTPRPPRPEIAEQQPTEAPKRISLNDLKANSQSTVLANADKDKLKKEQSAKNISALKEALAAVMKDPKSPTSPTIAADSQKTIETVTKTQTQTVSHTTTQTSQPSQQPQQQAPVQKEVPEDVLKKMLDVDEAQL